MSSSWPPGPSGRWWSGSADEFNARRLDFLLECARYGDVASFRFGRRRIILLNDPALIEQVLVADAAHYVKHFGLRMYRPLFGTGLVLAEGQRWLAQRRRAQPAFFQSRLTGYAPSFVELAERMADGWRDGEQRNLSADLMRLTGAVAFKTLFGADDDSDQVAFDAAFVSLVDAIQARLRSTLAMPDWLPTPTNGRLGAAVRKMDAILEGVLARRPASAAHDLAGRLIAAYEAHGGISARQLRDELMTVFIAGRETTAITLSWAWYLIARHPWAEQRLADEWAAVLKGRRPTYEDLRSLNYTAHVITETLRLYPPVTIVGREATRDVNLGGYRLPAGTTVFASQWVTHRDGRFFGDAEAFRPERWEGGLAHRLPKFAYFPFGGGPRLCIGNQFALMEAIMVLATVGPRWQLRLAADAQIEPWPGLTLRPRYGVPVVLSKRNAQGDQQ
jgi:cytochrome P450